MADRRDLESLFSVLDRVGKRPVRVGPRLLVLPSSGRVIGLYPSETVNALWTNPALDSVSTAEAFFRSEGWLNPGGSRGWISPEGETCVGDLSRFWESYEVPPAMDPARFEVVNADELSVTLASRMPLVFHRHNATLELTLTRRISIAEVLQRDVPTGIEAAGFRLDSLLEIDGTAPHTVRPAIWNLTQVPGGGWIRIPVGSNPVARPFIGTPAVEQEESCLVCKVQTDTSFKFALKAAACTGTMFYHLPGPPKALLLESVNSVLDERLYADYPAEDPEDTGYLQQVYVDDGAMGGFGELEYHSACIDPIDRKQVADSCEVVAYSGDAEAIDRLMTRRVKTAFMR